MATKEANISSEAITTWFSVLKDTLFFSNQRNVSVVLSASNARCAWIQSRWQRRCRLSKHSPQSSQSDSLPFLIPTCVHSFKGNVLRVETLAKDKSHFFSNPDSITQIQATLKYLAPEIPLLAPVALNWALTMHRLFSSLTGEGEEMPRTHIQSMVHTALISIDARQNCLRLKMELSNGIDFSHNWRLSAMHSK